MVRGHFFPVRLDGERIRNLSNKLLFISIKLMANIGGIFNVEKEQVCVKHPKGWAVKKPGVERSSAIFPTQREAEEWAKEIVSNLGGGEVRIQNRQGQWRDSDTVPPVNDPHPPEDTKH
jgi:hypothetical protein